MGYKCPIQPVMNPPGQITSDVHHPLQFIDHSGGHSRNTRCRAFAVCIYLLFLSHLSQGSLTSFRSLSNVTFSVKSSLTSLSKATIPSPSFFFSTFSHFPYCMYFTYCLLPVSFYKNANYTKAGFFFCNFVHPWITNTQVQGLSYAMCSMNTYKMNE